MPITITPIAGTTADCPVGTTVVGVAAQLTAAQAADTTLQIPVRLEDSTDGGVTWTERQRGTLVYPFANRDGTPNLTPAIAVEVEPITGLKIRGVSDNAAVPVNVFYGTGSLVN